LMMLFEVKLCCKIKSRRNFMLILMMITFIIKCLLTLNLLSMNNA
jgi:hypothetical protein